MPKIVFLGAGRMASAMVKRLIAKGVATQSDLVCMGGSGKTAEMLASQTGIGLARSVEELPADAGTLVVAFKPQQLPPDDSRLASLAEGRLVVSVLAGRRIERLSKVFPSSRNIVRCMPNTPARIGAGITGWCAQHELAGEDRATVGSILGALGQAVEVPEAQMDALTGVSGSGPAYVFEFAAALRDGGVAAGLDRATAERLANETILGAACLLARTHASPEALRDQVVSPHGTTFAALQRLSAGGFRELIRDAVLAAKARAEELSSG
jgi:pyrroline-5-carboxylate reductase